MQVTEATEDHVSKHADAFAELIHATGPVTYDYQFLRRELFDQIGFECLVETIAPVPLENGIPMEIRMAVDFSK